MGRKGTPPVRRGDVAVVAASAARLFRVQELNSVNTTPPKDPTTSADSLKPWWPGAVRRRPSRLLAGCAATPRYGLNVGEIDPGASQAAPPKPKLAPPFP